MAQLTAGAPGDGGRPAPAPAGVKVAPVTVKTETVLPAPLARSMASTAPGGPRAPPPPASLANSQTPPFLSKLYNLVEDARTKELVDWTAEGEAFTVHKPDEFGRDVLPRYFKHNNFSSFVRQLNQYGFHKRDPDRWTFGHTHFRRGRLDLLRLISRRRPKASAAAAQPHAQPHAHTNAHAQQQHAPIVAELAVPQAPQAVVEIGNYGLPGKVEALQRDKEVLVKELVITRKAEQALQEKCDGLESRLEMLESSTKQMQSFILHYFSKVLQPYSEELASRKRKRLPPAAPSPTDLIEPTSNIAAGGAAARLPAPTGTSLEALRHMMQQMQMSQGAKQQPHATGAGYAPAIVQELMHDDLSDVGGGGSGAGSSMRGSPTTSTNGFRKRPQFTPQPQVQVSSPESSWLVSPQPAVSVGDEVTPMEETNAADANNPNTSADVLEDLTLEGEWDGEAKEKRDVTEEYLDLDLLPPLTSLPEGTDINALARQIEGFGDNTE